MDLIGLEAERRAQPLDSTYEDLDGYTVFRTPSIPNYWDGNGIELWSEPDLTEIARWKAVFAEHFPDADHVSIKFETDPRPADAYGGALEDAARGAGLQAESVNVRVFTGLGEVLPARVPVDVAPAETDADWADVLGLMPHFEADFISMAYWERRVAEFRRTAEAGRGTHWVARVDDEPAATCGVYGDDELATVQDVVTAAPHRRQGVAGNLIRHALAANARAHPDALVTIMVEPGSDAERLYGRLGFTELVGVAWYLTHPH